MIYFSDICFINIYRDMYIIGNKYLMGIRFISYFIYENIKYYKM